MKGKFICTDIYIIIPGREAIFKGWLDQDYTQFVFVQENQVSELSKKMVQLNSLEKEYEAAQAQIRDQR